jgi:hypothetical protein
VHALAGRHLEQVEDRLAVAEAVPEHRGRLEVEQRLDRPAERHRVEVVREVVHPLDDRDRLPVRLVLRGLLDAGVDVADHRHDVAHDLALERGQEAQDAVRRRMVRPDVEREQLLLALVLDVGDLV